MRIARESSTIIALFPFRSSTASSPDQPHGLNRSKPRPRESLAVNPSNCRPRCRVAQARRFLVSKRRQPVIGRRLLLNTPALGQKLIVCCFWLIHFRSEEHTSELQS